MTTGHQVTPAVVVVKVKQITIPGEPQQFRGHAGLGADPTGAWAPVCVSRVCTQLLEPSGIKDAFDGIFCLIEVSFERKIQLRLKVLFQIRTPLAYLGQNFT
ncbi:hypothetical protein DPMN_109429 [Dreissena polymorpha]|uniref:Uncharacterized protein n=1 Tax=Dreissena polymorpha TaxID=45954 RepID=A0A9D4KA94_DREPO|nr:hypothetical protein DPMN_109429 [Dreissena polymorpha]